MASSIYIKGIDQLEKQVKQMLKEMGKEKANLLLGQARLIRDRIKEKAPVGETGNLKAAAYAAARPETTTYPVTAFAGIRPRKAPHGHLVEFGHGGPHPAPPHPFVRPAIDEMLPKVRENIKEGLKKMIEGSIL